MPAKIPGGTDHRTAQENITPNIPGLRASENVSGGGSLSSSARETALKNAGKAAGSAVGGAAGAKIGEQVGGFVNKVTGNKKGDKATIKKAAPAGAISALIIGIIVAISATLTTALPFHLRANLMETFDGFSFGVERRSSQIMRHMFTDSPTYGTMNKKYKNMSSRTVKRMRAHNIDVIDSLTGQPCTGRCAPSKLVVSEIDNTGNIARTIDVEAGNFNNELANNRQFSNNFIAAKQSRFRAFRSSVAQKVFRRLGISRNYFDDWDERIAQADGDSDEALKTAAAEETSIDSRSSTIDADNVTDEDGNVQRQITETNNPNSNTRTETTKTARLQSLVNNAILSKVSGISGVANFACMGATVAATVSIVAAGLNVKRSAKLFGTVVAEPIEKTMMGDEAPIHELMTSFNTQAVREDATGSAGSEDIEVEFVNSGEPAKTAMEAGYMRAIMNKTPADPNDPSIAKYSLENTLKNISISGAIGLSANMVRACAVAQIASNVISAVFTVASFGSGAAITSTMKVLGKQVAKTAAIAFAVSYGLQTLLPKIAESLATDYLTDAVGEDLGNAVASGAHAAYGNMHQGGAGVAADEATITAFHQENQKLIAQYAEIERAEKSPFDATSKYTFMGSLVSGFLPHISTMSSISGVFTSIASVASKSLALLLPTSNALALSSVTAGFGDCPALESIGVKGDATCQPWLVSPVDEATVSISPTDLYAELVQSGDIKVDGEENVTVVSGSNLAKFQTYCVDRNSQLGVYDPSIVSDQTQVVGGSAANIINALPVIGDIVGVIEGVNSLNPEVTDWANGQNCVNSAENTTTRDILPLYQIYLEDEVILENLTGEQDAIDSGAGTSENNPVTDGNSDLVIDGSGNMNSSAVQHAFASYMIGSGNSYGGYRLSINGCTTIAAWFIGTLTNLRYGGGNGWMVAQNLANANGLTTSSTPRAPAIFSTSDPAFSSANCSSGAAPNGKCGHTGIVTAVNSDGSITILDTSTAFSGDPNRSRLRTIARSAWEGRMTFAYVGDHMR